MSPLLRARVSAESLEAFDCNVLFTLAVFSENRDTLVYMWRLLDRLGLVPEPLARVVLVELKEGRHRCYDLVPGSYLVLDAGMLSRASQSPSEWGRSRVERLTGKAAMRRKLAIAQKTEDELRESLGAALAANEELSGRVLRQSEMLGAVLGAATLEEAKARAMWGGPAL